MSIDTSKPISSISYNGIEIPVKSETSYNEGKQAEYDAFWDAYQNNGARTDYNHAFGGGGYNDRTAGWDDNLFNPKYPFTNLVRASYMFINTQIEKKSISLHLSELATDLYQTFYNANLIQNIELWVHENLKYTNSFNGCYYVENLVIHGVIGQTVSFKDSNSLSHNSLMSIINALADKSTDTSGTSWKVTLGSNNLAKLSEEEKAIMDNKGWNYV